MNLLAPLSHALVAHVFVASVATCAVAQAHERLYSTSGPPGSSFGGSLCLTSDLDGDGVLDLVEGGAGEVTWLSGRTGAALRTVVIDPVPVAGCEVADGGDVDGDGVRDVIVGRRGPVEMRSGATGQVIWSAASPILNHGFTVASVRDRNGDGVPDVLIGAPDFSPFVSGHVVHLFDGGAGRAELRSGASGVSLAVIPMTATAERAFGGSVCSAGDVDGDGVGDCALAPYVLASGTVSHPLFAVGLVRVFSGATLAEIRALNGPPSTSKVAPLGDLDGDGRADILVSHCEAGLVRVYSGFDGSVLREWTGGGQAVAFGYSIASVGDVSGDGVTDIAIGSAQLLTLGQTEAGPGFVQIVSGASSEVLWTIAGRSATGEFGRALVVHPDLDGDGAPDLVVGSRGAARVEAFSSAEGYTRPQRLCVGGPSVGAQRARLDFTGHPTYTANDFALVISGAVPGKLGTLFYSRSVSVKPFGAGWSCLGDPVFRLGPALTTPPIGSTLTRDVDLTLAPLAAGPGAIAPGTTVYFQLHHRDTAAHGNFNASDALAVTFTP